MPIWTFSCIRDIHSFPCYCTCPLRRHSLSVTRGARLTERWTPPWPLLYPSCLPVAPYICHVLQTKQHPNKAKRQDVFHSLGLIYLNITHIMLSDSLTKLLNCISIHSMSALHTRMPFMLFTLRCFINMYV